MNMLMCERYGHKVRLHRASLNLGGGGQAAKRGYANARTIGQSGPHECAAEGCGEGV